MRWDGGRSEAGLMCGDNGVVVEYLSSSAHEMDMQGLV